jgi:hypothetical protein
MDETAITEQGFTHSELLCLSSVDVARAGGKRKLGSIPDRGIPAMRLTQLPI